ncbi:MAG: hypothetical protein AAF607_17605, partial [Pseudomonadota bacterium]
MNTATSDISSVTPLFTEPGWPESEPPLSHFEKLRRALTAAWQREHTQRLLWAPAGLAAGAGLYFNLPFEPPIAAG